VSLESVAALDAGTAPRQSPYSDTYERFRSPAMGVRRQVGFSTSIRADMKARFSPNNGGDDFPLQRQGQEEATTPFPIKRRPPAHPVLGIAGPGRLQENEFRGTWKGILVGFWCDKVQPGNPAGARAHLTVSGSPMGVRNSTARSSPS